MTPFDDSTESDNESEYFDACEYLENNDDSDSDDEFQDTRDSFNDEADSIKEELPQLNNDKKQESSKQIVEKEDPLPSAAATDSVLSEKRKFDNVAQDDQATDSNSPVASSSPCGASVNQPKKQKSVIVFGQSSGFGSMKVPQVASAIGNTAPTASSFAATKPFAFGARTTANNTLFNKGSTSSPDDSNKENDNYNGGAKSSIFGEAPREILAGVKETEVTTGEEDEETIFESKGKLYVMDANRNWKDHGVGTFRLNMDNSGVRRLVMRADYVHRLMLNQNLFAGMNKFIAEEKFIRFGTLVTKTNEEGETETKLVNYALKVASATTAQELCQQINIYIPKNRPRKRKVYKALEDDDQPAAGRRLSPKKQKNL